MPHCSSCHGGHDVLPSSVQRSRTHPSHLPATCGSCHENFDITSKYDILINTPVQIYNSSVHGRAELPEGVGLRALRAPQGQMQAAATKESPVPFCVCLPTRWPVVDIILLVRIIEPSEQEEAPVRFLARR